LQENFRYTSPFIEIRNVSFSYPRSELILKDINASFYRSEFVAIVGSNGSGKTTLGKLMVGILKPVLGNIFIKGDNINQLSPGKIGKLVGYLFQQPERQLFAPTVKEEIAFVLNFMEEPGAYVEKEVNRMMELFSLQGLKDSSPYKLSRGERQRLTLASILINGPEFLILDEPTTGLDIVRKNKLANTLKKLQNEGIGLAVISHDDDFIKENADRIIKVTGGEVIAAGPQD